MSERDASDRTLTPRFERDATANATRRDRGVVPHKRAVAWIVAWLVLAAFVVTFAVVGLRFLDQVQVSDVVSRFCHAEHDGNFGDAYALLSWRTRASVTGDDFYNAAGHANLLTCYAAQQTWTIDLYGNQAKVATWFVPLFGDSERVPGTMWLTREHGNWYIDRFSSPLLTVP
jgi:hypothetical protein